MNDLVEAIAALTVAFERRNLAIPHIHVAPEALAALRKEEFAETVKINPGTKPMAIAGVLTGSSMKIAGMRFVAHPDARETARDRRTTSAFGSLTDLAWPN